MRLYLCLTLLAFALSVCCSGAAFAAPIQDSPPADSGPATKMHSPDPQQQARRLARKLQLTPEQETEITSILQKRAQQIAQLRGDSTHGDSSMDARAQRSPLRSIRPNTEQQLRGVLSDSQLQQYQQLRQQARQRHLERQAPAGSASSNP
jgi:protein CpxP